MKKLFGAIIVVVLLAAFYTSNVKEEKRITLRATFKMGGVVYKGYEMKGDILIFKFERKGDVFTQIIETKKFTTTETFSPKKVLMEVTTEGETKVYEARLVEEKEDEVIYEALET